MDSRSGYPMWVTDRLRTHRAAHPARPLMQESKHENASYLISIARKIGCKIFLTWEVSEPPHSARRPPALSLRKMTE